MAEELNVLNVSVVEEQTEEIPEHDPSNKEKEVVTSVFYKFRKSAEERDKPLNIFDGRTLLQYVNDSFRRYNTSIDEREDVDDWQSRMHDPMTRNKLNTIHGRVVSQLPMGQISFRNDKDVVKASILDDLYQYSEEQDRYEIKMAEFLLDTMINGTGVLYEGHRNKIKKYRYVIQGRGGLEVEESIELKNLLYAESVPLLEFYPASINISSTDDMPYCFRRQVVNFIKFRQDYAEFDRAKYVQPYTGTETDTEAMPFHLRHISEDTEHGHVEVIKYYNQDISEYVIIANGVWINPIETPNGEEISPLPYDHGTLPFLDIKYELISSGVFYGKSFPNRVEAMQDVLNTLNNMLLDQAFLSIWPIILTNGIDSVEDDWLRPGRRIPIDTQGMPIGEAYSRLEMGTPSGFHQWITEYTRNILEEASVDKLTQGIAGVGGRTTAQEIRVAAQGVTSMLGMFGRFLNDVVKRKTKLRAKNILQFWTNPETPICGIIGKQRFNEAFNKFQRNDVSLSSGHRGTRIIEMYATEDEMPTQARVDARADAYEIDTGKEIEIIALTPEKIRELDFVTKYSANESSEEGRDVQLALELEKVRVYKSFFPDLVNDEELLANIAVRFGDDPTKIIMPKEPQQGEQEQMEQAMGAEQMPPLGQQPEGAAASNTIRREMGGIESPL